MKVDKAYEKLKETIKYIKDYASQQIDYNSAANFIKKFNKHLLTQEELATIYHDSSLTESQKLLVNDYLIIINQMQSILKNKFNFKKYFTFIENGKSIATAYIQPIKNKDGEIKTDADFELQELLEDK